MQLRGEIVDVGEVESVSTRYGDRQLAEIQVFSEKDGVFDISLWGDWTENVEYMRESMEAGFTELEETDHGYNLSGMMVVEPEYVVDVTDVRSWIQCPRMYYLNKISGTPLNYPVVKGTVVHQVFDDLLHGVDVEESVERRVEDSVVELDLLGKARTEVIDEVRQHASAIEGWLNQTSLLEEDGWRSEVTLMSRNFGIKGRCDALRRGRPVELKTGKSTRSDPYFQDKIQAAAYALLIGERRLEGGVENLAEFCPDTGTVIYTKNATPDVDVSPAKDFTVGEGLLDFVLRKRNEIAMYEHDLDVPTGYEADADCHTCFEKDTCMVVSGRLDQESKAGSISASIPEEEQEYFEEQYGFVENERLEVHDRYRDLYVSSLEERVENDRAARVKTQDVRPDGEGRYLVEVESRDATSKIREGNRVLASDGDPVRGEVVKVLEKNGSAMTLKSEVDTDFERIDVYPSEIGVDRMLTALHDFLLKSGERKKDVFFGRKEPEFRDMEGTYVGNNSSQNAAVNRVVNSEGMALIHGPPGTGKTYTIAKAVEALMDEGQQVLLSSFTNRAVDNAVEEIYEVLDEDDLKLVRMGTESGIREDMLHLRLEEVTDGAGDGTQLRSKLEALREADVVAATTSTCGSRLMRELKFDVALVDEASQLTDPQAFAALNLADRYVLVGDHRQLPPVAGTEVESVFESLIGRHPDAAVKLDRQYRMAQRIQSFSSQRFYGGEVYPADGETARQHLGELGVDRDAVDVSDDQVCFVDVDGRQVGNSNPREAKEVKRLVEGFIDSGVDEEDVGVIAPYRAQASEIQEALDIDVAVDTVDRFQGSSKEVILLSFTATSDLDGPLFDDHRRLNVALTRAKKKLVLVGDREALESRELYRKVLEWADRGS
ncbi:MAG: AAA domain-containing protein [Halobacteria archaeon]